LKEERDIVEAKMLAKMDECVRAEYLHTSYKDNKQGRDRIEGAMLTFLPERSRFDYLAHLPASQRSKAETNMLLAMSPSDRAIYLADVASQAPPRHQPGEASAETKQLAGLLLGPEVPAEMDPAAMRREAVALMLGEMDRGEREEYLAAVAPGDRIAVELSMLGKMGSFEKGAYMEDTYPTAQERYNYSTYFHIW